MVKISQTSSWFMFFSPLPPLYARHRNHPFCLFEKLSIWGGVQAMDCENPIADGYPGNLLHSDIENDP